MSERSRSSLVEEKNSAKENVLFTASMRLAISVGQSFGSSYFEGRRKGSKKCLDLVACIRAARMKTL